MVIGRNNTPISFSLALKPLGRRFTGEPGLHRNGDPRLGCGFAAPQLGVPIWQGPKKKRA